MRIVVAPDGFKDCLVASKVAEAMVLGAKDYDANATCHIIELSDGGDGFLNSIRTWIPDLEEVMVETVDPLGRSMKAPYLMNTTSKTAYVELAQASGIELLQSHERKVMETSTVGTGIQIKHAIDSGAKAIYVGLGGSATNDGGAGMAAALGYEFLNSEGRTLRPCGGNLSAIASIRAPKEIPGVSIFAINDVQNTLCGAHGAAFTYARQKGASETQIVALDEGLKNLSVKVTNDLGTNASEKPGSGAAGGSGYGLHVFMNAEFISGTGFILGLTNFHSILKEHTVDLILTGEGKIDHQTSYGKVVHGLISEGTKDGIPVAAICGKLDLSSEEVKALGLFDAKELFDPTKPSSYSYDNAARLIREKAFEICKTLGTTLQ